MFLSFTNQHMRNAYTGGGRSPTADHSAIKLIEILPANRENHKDQRVGDHIWYVSNMKKFKKDYLKGNKNILQKILTELVDLFLANFFKTKIERSNLIGKRIKLYLGKIKKLRINIYL